MKNQFTALLILDGFGINEYGENNAISPETAPYIIGLTERQPMTELSASGLDVGLPQGQMGNSEVGHLNIGAGRVIFQPLPRITKAIEDGSFFENEALLKAVRSAKENGKKLHLFGLLSDGGVHSHFDHILGAIDLAKREGLDNVYIHCFMDGRDVDPKSGLDFITRLQSYLDEIHFGKIATVSGRFYAMDRDNIWDRVEKAYTAIADGIGVEGTDGISIMKDSYANGVTDEFVIPAVVMENGKPVATVDEGDSIIFCNFRPDRARQITRSFIFEDFNGFERKKGYLHPCFVSYTQYDATFNDKLDVAFMPENYPNTLGEYFAKNNVRQLRIAETQKYAHVTFFFNGGVEEPNPLETRVLIDSPKIATFDMKPEMSAYEVCDRAIEEIQSGNYDAMILNFANCDMVGHTGIIKAAREAVVAVDKCVEKLVKVITDIGGQLLITADHGNCDYMFDPETKAPFTAHTTNPVPLIYINREDEEHVALMRGGKLCDIAPTLLDMMELEQPDEMTGHSLIVRSK